MKRNIWVKPQVHQKLWAILVELFMLAVPFITWDSTIIEPITPLFALGVMVYTLLVSAFPIYAFCTKKYLLFDMYPLKLAQHLQAKGKLGRKARYDLERCGVQFDCDENGWYVTGYDAPSFYSTSTPQ